MKIRPFSFAALCIAAASLSACGGGEPSSDATTTPASQAPTGQTAAIAAHADDISSCLQDQGLTVTEPDARFFGVEVEYERMEVALHSDTFDEDYTADVVVFGSEQDALDSRPAITLQSEDDQRNKVIGDVLVSYSIVPDAQHLTQIEGCVTGADG